jgi:DNA-binding NtrC family response regulator
LTKPVELPALLVILERLLEAGRLARRQLAGRARPGRGPLDPFLGTSPAIRALADEARRVAGAESPVLILGETGTGKGVLASWLHRSGPRRAEPFVDINCAGLGRELLDSELFGHEKGAFTGATAAKQGLLEIAHRGTLFLDEIGDMDPGVQAKLLKVVEEKSFRRLGGVRTHTVDARLLTATRLDPLVLVRDGRFREDLYYRVSTVVLRMPALRERTEDIGVLARRILGDLASELGKAGLGLSPDALGRLESHAWPGNLRELRNVLERAALLFDAPVLGAEALRFGAEPGFAGEPGDGDLTLAALERRHIERVLSQEDGHVERAARRLGIPRSSLYQKIKILGIH